MAQEQDYDEFEKDWKRRHKASLPRKVSVSSVQEIFWIVFWLIVASGAALFSAAHTIPAAEMTLFSDLPYRSSLAITAFIIVELVIFGAAAKRHEIRWLGWLLLGSLLVALIGNTSSSIQAVAENGGNILNQVGGVLLSVIAPVTALAAGEVLHIQLDNLAIKRQIANADYQQQWKEVEAKINTAYTKYVKELKAVFQAVNPVNFNSFNQDKRNKPSKKLEAAVKWLNEHPEYLDTESRELIDQIGVSHVTIWKAQQQIKHYQNGHSDV